MSRSFLDPRKSNIFLDTCAFDPKIELEATCAWRMRQLFVDGKISLILSHTNQKEIEHPNTPAIVKTQATATLFTLPIQLTPQEMKTQLAIHEILRGDAKLLTHYADATHIAEATKYGGCFITTDKRILSRKSELKAVGAKVLKPSEWIAIYEYSG